MASDNEEDPECSQCGNQTDNKCQDCEIVICGDQCGFIISPSPGLSVVCKNCWDERQHSQKKQKTRHNYKSYNRNKNFNRNKNYNENDNNNNNNAKNKNKKLKKHLKGKKQQFEDCLSQKIDERNKKRQENIKKSMSTYDVPKQDNILQDVISAYPLALRFKKYDSSSPAFILDSLSKNIFQTKKQKMAENSTDNGKAQTEIFEQLLKNKQTNITEEKMFPLQIVLDKMLTLLCPSSFKMGRASSKNEYRHIGNQKWSKCNWIEFIRSSKEEEYQVSVVMALLTNSINIDPVAFVDCSTILRNKATQIRNGYRQPLIYFWDTLNFDELENQEIEPVDFLDDATEIIKKRIAESMKKKKISDLLKRKTKRRMLFGALWQLPLEAERFVNKE